eukprot:scaffold568_cov160-Amphora_coffeaeformis.AAC.11
MLVAKAEAVQLRVDEGGRRNLLKRIRNLPAIDCLGAKETFEIVSHKQRDGTVRDEKTRARTEPDYLGHRPEI